MAFRLKSLIHAIYMVGNQETEIDIIYRTV